MLSPRLRDEMVFYATTGDYSDAERYDKFARDCGLDEKALEIGFVVKNLISSVARDGDLAIEILETASATGLTAVGVREVLAILNIEHFYTSLDKERNLLKYAKARERGDFFVQGDFEDLPFRNEAFDVCIMMGAEGYRVKGTFYAEVTRVLRRGGFFVMPQIGPRPFVSSQERRDAARAGLLIIRADNYLVARKPQ